MKVCNKKVEIGVAEKKREGYGVMRGCPGWGDGGLVVGEGRRGDVGTSTTLLKDGRLGVTVPGTRSTVYRTQYTSHHNLLWSGPATPQPIVVPPPEIQFHMTYDVLCY
jgi:hypothetical protein